VLAPHYPASAPRLFQGGVLTPGGQSEPPDVDCRVHSLDRRQEVIEVLDAVRHPQPAAAMANPDRLAAKSPPDGLDGRDMDLLGTPPAPEADPAISGHIDVSPGAVGSWGRRRRPSKNFRAGGTILARHDLIDVLATSSSQASLDRHERRPHTDHDPQGAGTGRINRVKESVCVGNTRGSTCLAMPGALEESARDD